MSGYRSKAGVGSVTAQLPADHGLTRDIDTVDLENVLRQIKADRADFGHRTAPS